MLRVLASIFLMSVLIAPALPQERATEDGEAITGRVVSSTRNTVTIRTSDGQYRLFVLDSYTARPQNIIPGSTIRVAPGTGGDDENGAQVARAVTVVSAAPTAQAPGEQDEVDAIPASIRRLENDIERSVRRFGLGVRGGFALDPELVLVGVQANLGSIFTDRIRLRPSAQFAWGEVTNMFALNLEAMYRLPFSPPRGRWSAYVGGGPGFFFSSQNFERAAQGDRDIDFDDFDFNAGLNLFSGVEFRNGMFMEAKTTVYASPHLRLIIGYNF